MIKSNWKKITAVVLLLAVVYFVVFHWNRFRGDFWPLDKATVSPNLLASVIQWAIIFIFLALLYPPFRRWVEKVGRGAIDEVKNHVSAEHAKLHERLDHHNAKLNHIILNSTMENEVPGVPAAHQPEAQAPAPAPAPAKKAAKKTTKKVAKPDS